MPETLWVSFLLIDFGWNHKPRSGLTRTLSGLSLTLGQLVGWENLGPITSLKIRVELKLILRQFKSNQLIYFVPHKSTHKTIWYDIFQLTISLYCINIKGIVSSELKWRLPSSDLWAFFYLQLIDKKTSAVQHLPMWKSVLISGQLWKRVQKFYQQVCGFLWHSKSWHVHILLMW